MSALFSTRARPANRQLASNHRHGNVIVFSAVMMVVLMAMLAFSLDVGYMSNTQTELRRAVDAGALAGAGVLVHGSTAAQPVVIEYLQRNLVGARVPDDEDIVVEAGHWDANTKTFTVSNQTPSALRVLAQHRNQPLFFARVLGVNAFNLQAEAIAQYQPRDIMLVLDLSGSMNYDSTWRGFRQNDLTQNYVEANMAQIYADLGSPQFGNMTFNGVTVSSTNHTTIRNTLGLNNVPYPYPGGSWDDYFDYVHDTSASPNSIYDSVVYRKNYGYKTWIQYLLDQQSSHTATPALAQARAQPVTALKDAVEVFLSYMQSIQTEDQLGLVVYNSASENAVLENSLTPDLTAINTLVQARQAGHYNRQTNIGAGLREARLELQNHARPGAFKMILLMTDGRSNRPTNESVGTALVNSEAALCAAARIPVVTISMGAGADAALMQSVANVTKGAHFNIPGGQTASEYEEQLTEVFGQVASTRPLKLVQ